MILGKEDPEDEKRVRAQDLGKAAAGKSTLNRLELTPASPAQAELRYQKIIMKPEEMDRLFVDVFLQAHSEAPEEIVLDVDATDGPLHEKARTMGTPMAKRRGRGRSPCPLRLVADSHIVKSIEPQLPAADFPATHAGAALGTIAYMSPEQAQGKPASG
jgi:hypothetical protein